MAPRTQNGKADHDHTTPEKKTVATENEILRTRVGSVVHGMNVATQDDEDEMGICLEPPSYVTGLKRFEQYEWHTAWEREGGRKNRSGPGDTDLVIYSARKWMRLALKGNPSIIIPLFAPEGDLLWQTDAGRELRSHRDQIVSQEAAPRFLGYLQAQKRSLLSHEGKGRDVTRPDLEKYGFDVKFAAHMVRLGLQGAELLGTGKISIPMEQEWQDDLRALRRGERTMMWALGWAAQFEVEIKFFMDHPDEAAVPLHPDRHWANLWLQDAYLAHWGYEWKYKPREK